MIEIPKICLGCQKPIELDMEAKHLAKGTLEIDVRPGWEVRGAIGRIKIDLQWCSSACMFQWLDKLLTPAVEKFTEAARKEEVLRYGRRPSRIGVVEEYPEKGETLEEDQISNGDKREQP